MLHIVTWFVLIEYHTSGQRCCVPREQPTKPDGQTSAGENAEWRYGLDDVWMPGGQAAGIALENN